MSRRDVKAFFLGLAALACLLAVPALAAPITIDMVTVGNPGNAGDTKAGTSTFGKGSVAYSYQIGKYDVTIGQYAAFLNAVAAPTPTRSTTRLWERTSTWRVFHGQALRARTRTA